MRRPTANLKQVRQDRALRTDELIRRASLEVLAEDGYASLAFTRVSERASVSRRPVHDRYSDRRDVVADLWVNVCAEALAQALTTLFDAYESEVATSTGFAEALAAFISPNEELLGAVEILVLSQFHMRLRTLTTDSATTVFEPMIAHDHSQPAIRRATKRAYVASYALGFLLTSRLPASEPIDFSPDADRLFRSLQKNAEIRTLPADARPILSKTVPFNTGDTQLDALLRAAIDEVCEAGFDGATTLRIARRAGMSEGFLFSKYDSKLDLFVDAVKRKTQILLKLNHDAVSAVATEHGQVAADALMIRESMDPAGVKLRTVALEQLRIAMHNAGMRRANTESLEKFVEQVRAENAEWAALMTLSRARFSYAVGMGVAAVPLVMPNAWVLPFDSTVRALAELES